MFRASYTLRARVSLALYVHIRNAMQEVVAQSKQGREQSPLVEQGMSHLKYIYISHTLLFPACYLHRLIFPPNPMPANAHRALLALCL